MRLHGFRCDECGVESRQKPRGRWIEVMSMMITNDGWSNITNSDGLHYCSKECLLAAAAKWPDR